MPHKNTTPYSSQHLSQRTSRPNDRPYDDNYRRRPYTQYPAYGDNRPYQSEAYSQNQSPAFYGRFAPDYSVERNSMPQEQSYFHSSRGYDINDPSSYRNYGDYDAGRRYYDTHPYSPMPHPSAYGDTERNFLHRASDEVASWFGDKEAEYRRHQDSIAREHERRMQKNRPKNYVRSDERIHEDVNDRLAEHSYLDASDIEVQVKGGEITLSGTVCCRFDKRLAEDIADSVSGVSQVQNNLRIKTGEEARRS